MSGSDLSAEPTTPQGDASGERTTQRPKHLTRQIVVRIPEDLYQVLDADAYRNGRTIAQTVRHRLKEALQKADGYVAPY